MVVVPQLSKTTEKLTYLKRRVRLTNEEENVLHNGLHGYLGEKSFATILEANFSGNFSVLYDVLLEYQNSHFQIDALLMQDEHLYLFEIKHFYGDYVYQDDNFYKAPKIYSANGCNLISFPAQFMLMLFSITLHSHYIKLLFCRI